MYQGETYQEFDATPTMYQGQCYVTASGRWKWRIYYHNGNQYEPIAVSVKSYKLRKGAKRALTNLCTRSVKIL